MHWPSRNPHLIKARWHVGSRIHGGHNPADAVQHVAAENVVDSYPTHLSAETRSWAQQRLRDDVPKLINYSRGKLVVPGNMVL